MESDKPIRVHSTAPWEKTNGYCRAIRVGPHVYVSGTTATDDHGTIVGKGDAGEQAKRTFLNIKKAMASLGADLATHTIRTRMFVVDLKRWASIIGLVHGSIFNHNNDQNDYDNNNNDDGECRGCCHPVSSMIGVSSLYDEDMLIEIEVEAFVPDRSVK